MSAHHITIEAAVALTTRARQTKLLPVNAWAFDRDILDAILAQPGAAGVRIYLGVKEDGSPTPVLVGTDANGADLAAGTLGEEAKPCPPYCDQASPLA